MSSRHLDRRLATSLYEAQERRKAHEPPKPAPSAPPQSAPPQRKYRNEPQADGSASKHESKRGQELRLLQQAGAIEQLVEQCPFVLIPTQRNPDGSIAERAVVYVADYTYVDRKTRERIVEDSKGVRTAAYVIKRKLMRFLHNIIIREV